jgi:hypothetical protein
MVALEIRSPQFDRDRETVDWEAVAWLRVTGNDYDLEDPSNVVDLSLPVLNLRTSRKLSFADEPEEWARNLPTAYRGPELIAVIVDDDNPVPVADVDVERAQIEVPETVHGIAASR